MAVKDVSQVGQLSLIDGSKKTSRAEESRIEEQGPKDKVTEDKSTEDRVSVSESSDLSKVISSAQVSASASRTSVIQAIAASVRQGTYKPDPHRIAEQILDEAELIARMQAMLRR